MSAVAPQPMDWLTRRPETERKIIASAVLRCRAGRTHRPTTSTDDACSNNEAAGLRLSPWLLVQARSGDEQRHLLLLRCSQPSPPVRLSPRVQQPVQRVVGTHRPDPCQLDHLVAVQPHVLPLCQLRWV